MCVNFDLYICVLSECHGGEIRRSEGILYNCVLRQMSIMLLFVEHFHRNLQRGQGKRQQAQQNPGGHHGTTFDQT